HPAGHHFRSGVVDRSFYAPENCVMDSIAHSLPVLGLMLGDCTGIGPEQCARILSDGRLDDAARLVVIGDARVLQQGARDAGVELSMQSYAAPEAIDGSRPGIPVIDLGNLEPARITRGRVSAASGR